MTSLRGSNFQKTTQSSVAPEPHIYCCNMSYRSHWLDIRLIMQHIWWAPLKRRLAYLYNQQYTSLHPVVFFFFFQQPFHENISIVFCCQRLLTVLYSSTIVLSTNSHIIVPTALEQDGHFDLSHQSKDSGQPVIWIGEGRELCWNLGMVSEHQLPLTSFNPLTLISEERTFPSISERRLADHFSTLHMLINDTESDLLHVWDGSRVCLFRLLNLSPSYKGNDSPPSRFLTISSVFLSHMGVGWGHHHDRHLRLYHSSQCKQTLLASEREPTTIKK